MHSFLLAAVVAIVAVGPAAAQQLSGLPRRSMTAVPSSSATATLRRRSRFWTKKQPAGYSVDLCLRIVEAVKTKLGRPDLTVKYVPVSAENRFDKVAEGTIDLECGNTTHTLSGQKAWISL